MMYKKIPNRIRFLAVVVLFYGIVYVFAPQLATGAFLSFLETFWHILPVVVLAFGILFLGNMFFDPRRINRHLGHESGIKGWLWTLLGSIVFSGPPYIMFPLLGELKKHGMKYSLLAVFLNNRNVRPQFLPVLAYYFGWQFAVVFSVYTLLYSLCSGLIMGRMMRK